MKKILLLLVLCFCGAGMTKATTYYYVSGAYTTAGSWNTVEGGGGTAATVFTNTADIWVVDNTTLAMSSAWTIAGTLQIGGGTNATTVTISTTAPSLGGCNVYNNATLTLSINPTFTAGNILTNSGGTLNQNVASTAASPAMAATQNGTVAYGAGASHVLPAATFKNLTLNDAITFTTAGNITVNGALVINASNILSMGTYAIAGTPTSVTNNGTVTTASTTNPAIPAGQNWAGSTGTVSFAASGGGQFIPAGTYGTLTFANTSGTNTAEGILTVLGPLATTSGGTLAMTTYALAGTPTSVTNNGTITTTSTTNPAIPAGQTWSGTTGAVNFTLGTGGQYVPAGTYGTLSFTNTSGTNTAVGNIVVNTSFTSSGSGGTLNMGTNTLSGTLTTFTNSGTLQTQNTSTTPIPSGLTVVGTVNYNAATGGQTIVPETSYNTLTLGNTSGTSTAGGALTVNTALVTTAGGTFDMSTYALAGTLSTITNNGTIQTENTSTTPFTTGKTWGGTGTLIYNAATGGQTLMAGTYNCKLTMGNTSGTNTASGGITINNVLTTTAGGTFDMSTYAMAGTLTTITNNGTLQTENTSAAPFTSGKIYGGTGVVNYNITTGGQTVMTGTYTCGLTMSNTSGTNTASGILTLNGSLVTTAGGTLSIATTNYAIAGTPTSVTNNGTISTVSTVNPALPAGQNWSGTDTTGTIIFARNNGGQYIPGGTYYSLTLSGTGGTNTAEGVLTVNGPLTITSGGTLAMTTYALAGTPTTVANNGTITTTSITNPAIPAGYNWSGTTGTVTFSLATGGQYVPTGTYKTLTFANTSGTNTATGNLTVTTSITTSSAGGTLDMGTYTLGGAMTTFKNTGTIKTQNTSSTPLPTGFAVAGTVNYYAPTGGQTIVSETSYTTLTLSNTSGTNTSAANLKLTTLNTTAGGTLDMTAAYRITALTTCTNNGIIQTEVPTTVSAAPFPSGVTWGGTGTVIYNATTGAQTVMSGTYNCNLTVANTSGTDIASNVITIKNNLTTTSGGTLNMSTYAIAGTPTSITNNGTITTSTITNPAFPSGQNWTGTTGVVIFALATGGQYIPLGTYGTLKLSNSSGTTTAVGVLTVNNSLITSSAGTLAMGLNQLLGAFTPTNNGSITTTSTANPAIPAGQNWSGTTGAVTFAATTGAQNIPSGTFKTLTFSNTSGTNTAQGNIVVTGTMTTTAGGTLNMGSAYTLSGMGTFTNNGIISTSVPTTTSTTPIPSGLAWAGTVTYAATAGAQTVVAGTYKNLTLSNTSGINTAGGNIVTNAGTMTTAAGGTLDMGATYLISGSSTFTNNGNIQTEVPTSVSATPIPAGQAWAGTITYGATAGSQTIVSETSYNNLTFGNTSGTNTSAANLVVNGALTTASGAGIEDMGTFTLSGTLSSISGGGTIKTANATAAPIRTGETWTQTIQYYNATGSQTIVGGTYNGGLTNSNTSGTNTLAAAITVAGNLTFSPGSLLSDGGYTLTLNGNVAGTGTHTGTGSIQMTGSGGTISGAVLQNLTLNNSGGFSLTGSPTINGTLTLTAGTLNIGTNNLILASSAPAVAGTLSASNMIIANGGGSVEKMLTGTGAYTFPIGDNASNYSPVTLTFTGGTFGGGAYAAVNDTNAKQPENANTTNYINRYWTVATNAITTPVYNISATFVSGDVVGTATNISMGQYPEALPWIKYGVESGNVLSATGITNSTLSQYTGVSAAIPTVSVVPSSSIICSGLPVNLTATGGGDPTLSYSWSPSTGLSATTGAMVTATLTTGSVAAIYVYTVTVTDGNGFTGTGISSFTVNPVPVIGGNLNNCVGLSTTLIGNVTGGTWVSGNTAIATIGSTSGMVTGVMTGTAFITYTLGTGCYDTAIEMVNSLPSAITGTTTFCQNLTTTLSDMSGGIWSSGNISVATVGSATGVVSAVTAGTAVITFSGGDACNVTTTVTINPITSITGSYTACIGSTTNLTDTTTGGTWISSNPTAATVGSTNGIVNGVALGTTIITYLLPTGCRDTNYITVNAVPGAIGGTTNVCVGLNTTLTEGGGGTWSSSNTSVATIGSATGIANGVVAGTTIITFTSGSNCYATTTVTVNPLPSSISGTLSVCAGLNTTLSDGGGGTWSSGSSNATVGSGTGTVTGVTAGTANITYTLSTGCIATAPVTVNPLPGAITGTMAVCVGLTTTLTNGTSGGTWSTGNSNASIGSTSGVVTGVTAGTSSISYTLVSTGCMASAVVVIIDPLPAGISGATAVCVGLSTTLGDATYSGTWSSSNTSIATIGSGSGTVTGVVAGSLSITYTLGTGCLTSIPFTVNPLPAAIIGSGTVCNGITTTLTNPTAGGTWTSSNTGVATIGSGTGIVTGASAGTIIITYTISTGCIATKPLTVNPLPASISGTTSYCEGNTATLSDGSSGGTWSISDFTVATIGSSSGFVTAESAGPATVTYTLPTTCINTVNITVNPDPDEIAGAIDTCVGLTVNLTNSTSGGTWSSSNTAVGTIGSTSGAITGLSAGETIVTYTLGTGCYSLVGVPFDPVPSAIGGNLAVCIGSATTLTNTLAGGTWVTSNSSVATIDSNAGILTSVAAGTTLVTYVMNTGCNAYATATVNQVPSLASAINNGPVCAGGTLTLTANTPANVTGYSWAGPVGITSSTSVSASVPSATTSASGTYTVTLNNGTGIGCTATYTTAATVNTTPTAAPTNSSPICNGGTVTLTANPSGGTTVYAWSGPNLSSAAVQNPTATPTVTTTYSLTVTNGTSGSGCSPTMIYTTMVTVNTTPTAAPTNSGPICNGGTVTLTANPAGSTSVYSWSGANLSSSVAQNPTATPTVTTTYSLTVTNGTSASGCTPSTVYTTTVTVNAKPTAAPTNSGPICNGGTVTLTANPGGSASAYTWGGSNLSSTTVQNPTATPTVTTVYSLTVTNGTSGSGCSPTTIYTAMVTVNTTPTAAPTNSSPICNGGTVTLTANPGGSTSVYSWSGANLSSTTVQNPTATPTATTIYSLTVTNGTSASGCAPATIYTTSVTVNTTPTAAPTNSSPICKGGTVTLTANPGGSASAYTWGGANLSSTTAQNPTATPTVTTTYSLTVTNGTSASGCTPATIYTTSVTVNPVPAITSAGNNGPICAGNALDLTTTASGGTGSLSYAWAGPSSFSSTTQNPAISAATTVATGTYTITVTDANGCTSASNTAATVNPTPSAGTISGASSVCTGDSITLTATVSGGTWASGSANATARSVTGTTASVVGVMASEDIITYTVTNTYACSSAATKLITVNPNPGIILTLAGTTTAGYSGDGSAGIRANLNTPRDLVTDASGNVYVCDLNNNVIRKISTTGMISTIAGTGVAGNSGDGGQATAATLNGPNGVFVDASGNIFIANTGSATIRKINTSGIITTIAGTGTAGYSGDGGQATAAQLNSPLGICNDASGNIYIADQSNYRVRKITVSTGVISTIVGTGTNSYSGDGGPGTAAGIAVVRDVKTDNWGNLYIADAGNQVIRKYNISTGTISTFAGINHNPGSSGDGGPATAAKFNTPARFAYDGGNMLYVADQLNYKIRQINISTGIVSTVAGNGTSGYSGDGNGATSAEFNQPSGIACDQYGNLYISDALNNVVRQSATNGSIAIALAGSTTVPPSTPVTFTAHSSLTGLTTSIQWQKNGTNVGTDTSVYTDASPTTGSVYRCILAITPECASSYYDTSNSITITVSSGGRNSDPAATTSVPQGSNNESLRIYPNPVSGNLSIEGAGMENGTVLANVYNTLGVNMMTQTSIVQNNQLNMVLDMAPLPAGMYLVSITDMTGKKEVFKCLKN